MGSPNAATVAPPPGAYKPRAKPITGKLIQHSEGSSTAIQVRHKLPSRRAHKDDAYLEIPSVPSPDLPEGDTQPHVESDHVSPTPPASPSPDTSPPSTLSTLSGHISPNVFVTSSNQSPASSAMETSSISSPHQQSPSPLSITSGTYPPTVPLGSPSESEVISPSALETKSGHIISLPVSVTNANPLVTSSPSKTTPISHPLQSPSSSCSSMHLHSHLPEMISSGHIVPSSASISNSNLLDASMSTQPSTETQVLFKIIYTSLSAFYCHICLLFTPFVIRFVVENYTHGSGEERNASIRNAITLFGKGVGGLMAILLAVIALLINSSSTALLPMGIASSFCFLNSCIFSGYYVFILDGSNYCEEWFEHAFAPPPSAWNHFGALLAPPLTWAMWGGIMLLGCVYSYARELKASSSVPKTTGLMVITIVILGVLHLVVLHHAVNSLKKKCTGH